MVMPSGDGLVASPRADQRRANASRARLRSPAACSAARRASRAVSATDSLIRPMRGGRGWPAPCGHGRVAERDPQVSVGYVVGVAAMEAGAIGRAGSVWRRGAGLDSAAQGVADGDAAELSEGGQGGVPADGVPGAGLALVPAEHVLPGFEGFFCWPAAPGDGDEACHRGEDPGRRVAQIEGELVRAGQQPADEQEVPRARGSDHRPVADPGSLGPGAAGPALEDPRPWRPRPRGSRSWPGWSPGSRTG